MENQSRNPRVFIHEDTSFEGSSLSEIIEQAGCDLVWDPTLRDLGAALGSIEPPIDLIVLVLHTGSKVRLETVAEIRRHQWLAAIPILVVSSLSAPDLDLWQLRALGVVGLIHSEAPPEHVRFRVGQVAYRGRDGRRFERAPCCIPIELEANGKTSTDYAVSLSAGGVGIATSRRIEPNTLVGLRFSLDEGLEPISISGRTVHMREVQREDAAYQIGVFFHRLDEAMHKDITAAVGRLLAAWDAIGGSNLIGDDEDSVEVGG